MTKMSLKADHGKAISPLDGRYGQKLQSLSEYFSEYALMRMRCMVELQYLEALDDADSLFPKLSETDVKKIHLAKHKFTEDDYVRIKEIEGKIHHDVKACEVFLREKLGLSNNNMIHFGLTSEDVNNIAYTLLIKEYVEKQQIPMLERLLRQLSTMAERWIAVPFPSRTHGQKASPSTAGKEIAVFMARIIRQFKRLRRLRFVGKLNGATGNFSAMYAAFPDFDWIYFSCNFLERLGLLYNISTTQIEGHDTWAEYFSIVNLLNNIILDLDKDIWLYLTLGYMKESGEEGAVGSSTMPHKVNPIRFENSEGNLEISNSLLSMLFNKLTHSRMQRDLSNSTVMRNIGVALSHSHLALSETVKGLSKIEINEPYCLSELDNSPELLAEPIQTILRVENIDDPYSLLKEFTRGKRISDKDISAFIDQLEVSPEVKDRLRSLKTRNYTGQAAEICKLVLEDAKSELRKGDMG